MLDSIKRLKYQDDGLETKRLQERNFFRLYRLPPVTLETFPVPTYRNAMKSKKTNSYVKFQRVGRVFDSRSDHRCDEWRSKTITRTKQAHNVRVVVEPRRSFTVFKTS